MTDTSPVRLLGLTVSCDRLLPGEVLDADTPVDVEIVRNDAILADGHVGRSESGDWPQVAVTDDRATVLFDDDALFEVDACSRRISYSTFGDLDDLTFAHEVVDGVLPRFVAMLGSWVLHGGCVSGLAGACVFVGRSGSGKSTLAAALAAAGYQFLGDDVAIVESVDGVDYVLPSGTHLRLYQDAAQAAFVDPTLGPAMAYWSSKRLLVPAANGINAARDRAPLTAVVELSEGGTSPELVKLDGGTAFELLARNSFDLPDDRPNAGITMLERWAPLAGRVAAYRLTRPFDLNQLDAVCALLRPLLDGDG